MISRYLVGLVLALGARAALGCGGDGGEGGELYAPAEPPENAVPAQAAPAPCHEGRTAFCTQIMGHHGAVTSCFNGVETCVDGKWSGCQALPDPPGVTAPASTSGGIK